MVCLAEGDNLGGLDPGIAPVVYFACVEVPDGWVRGGGDRGGCGDADGGVYGDACGIGSSYYCWSGNKAPTDLWHKVVDEIALPHEICHLRAALEGWKIVGGELRYQLPEWFLGAYEGIRIRVDEVGKLDEVRDRTGVGLWRRQGVDLHEGQKYPSQGKDSESVDGFILRQTIDFRVRQERILIVIARIEAS